MMIVEIQNIEFHELPILESGSASLAPDGSDSKMSKFDSLTVAS
jgi:hypothetical protein